MQKWSPATTVPMVYFSERHVERDHTFPVHRHVDHELLWLTRGGLQVSCRGSVWRLTARTAVVVPAGIEHDAEATRATTFRDIYIEPVANDPLAVDSPFLVVMSAAIRQALDELESGRVVPDRRRHLERALAHLLRAAEVPVITAPPVPVDERARRAAELVVGDPARRASIVELGRAVGASPRTLSRLFVAETGMSFAGWRTAALTHRALELLGDGWSSGSVAAALGYRDASAFSRAFRAVTGLRPSDVRAGRAGAGDAPVRTRHVLGPGGAGWTRTEVPPGRRRPVHGAAATMGP